jgi:hypothetical protein
MNRATGFCTALLFSLLAARAAFAYLSPIVELTGKVSDFDDHYLFLNATTERYRVERRSVPATVELKPGIEVSFEIPLDSLKVLPLTSAAPKPPAHYKPPRKRVTAQE